MREILFKAKRTDNGEWVEGYIVHYPTGEWKISRKCDDASDCDPMWQKVLISYGVDPNTICQYTGLTDKNGNKIWENDVLKTNVSHEIAEGYRTGRSETGVICYDSMGVLSLQTSYVDEKPCYSDFFFQIELADCDFEIEAIGNIFDNPELLKEE